MYEKDQLAFKNSPHNP